MIIDNVSSVNEQSSASCNLTEISQILSGTLLVHFMSPLSPYPGGWGIFHFPLAMACETNYETDLSILIAFLNTFFVLIADIYRKKIVNGMNGLITSST